MCPDNEDADLARLMAERRVKRPPDAVLKDYVEEVREKIAAQPAGPGWGVAVGLALAVALAAALLFGLLVQRKAEREPAQVTAASGVLPAVLAPSAPLAEEALESEQLESLEDDLFLLEMLGEDEGLIDVPGRIETDLEVFEQVGLAG